MSWHQFEGGNSIGQKGKRGGTIVFDEEHKSGARITITKGKDVYPKLYCTDSEIYDGGYRFLAHYTSTEEHARQDVEIIKVEFEKIFSVIAKTPPIGKRNYENMSKIALELYNLKTSEKFKELLHEAET